MIDQLDLNQLAGRVKSDLARKRRTSRFSLGMFMALFIFFPVSGGIIFNADQSADKLLTFLILTVIFGVLLSIYGWLFYLLDRSAKRNFEIIQQVLDNIRN